MWKVDRDRLAAVITGKGGSTKYLKSLLQYFEGCGWKELNGCKYFSRVMYFFIVFMLSQSNYYIMKALWMFCRSLFIVRYLEDGFYVEWSFKLVADCVQLFANQRSSLYMKHKYAQNK